jgi:hypothetical protein
MRALRITIPASQDLDAISDYFLEQSVDAGDRFVEAFNQKCIHPLEILIKQLDFDAMAKVELRAYVISHPDDKLAFQALVDRLTANASTETFNIPNSDTDFGEVERLIRQKVEQARAD